MPRYSFSDSPYFLLMPTLHEWMAALSGFSLFHLFCRKSCLSPFLDFQSSLRALLHVLHRGEGLPPLECITWKKEMSKTFLHPLHIFSGMELLQVTNDYIDMLD